MGTVEQLQMTEIAYSSLEGSTGYSVCSGKGEKLATEYSIVQSLFHFEGEQD